MFNKILLPLDGSDMAESVIPYGEALARRLGSELVLIHACDESHNLNHTMHRLYLEKRAELVAEGFLSSAGEGQSPCVTAVTQFGELAPVIHDYVEQNGIDLVIMVSGGLNASAARPNSVADDVFRVIGCPSMLVPPRAVAPGKPLFSQILVPLDGTPGSEQALAPAAALAAASDAVITLFSMVKELVHSEPESDLVGDRGLYDIKGSLAAQEKTGEYLETLAWKMRDQGLDVDTRVDVGSDGAKLISAAARVLAADMVVMATTSRVSTWGVKSVTHKLLLAGDLPLLIVRQE
ncbi:universal stress protein [Dehalogenimonas sp. THU2]|uniref:universal stress protein n=1 Tax=Dehalogenimonas sp. THU2 TaxID=3151121 RepID=UPI00321858AD